MKDEFAGSVKLDNLYDIFGFYSSMKKTCQVEIESLNRVGVVYLQAGSVVHCESDDGKKLEGEEAFLNILLWKSAKFSVHPEVEAPRITILKSYENLLIQSLASIDEYNRNRATKPSYEEIKDDDFILFLRTMEKSLENILSEVKRILNKQS